MIKTLTLNYSFVPDSLCPYQVHAQETEIYGISTISFEEAKKDIIEKVEIRNDTDRIVVPEDETVTLVESEYLTPEEQEMKGAELDSETSKGE